jgi:uncharacterized membrane-anchored protein YitT (DUF2179 family)
LIIGIRNLGLLSSELGWPVGDLGFGRNPRPKLPDGRPYERQLLIRLWIHTKKRGASMKTNPVKTNPIRAKPTKTLVDYIFITIGAVLLASAIHLFFIPHDLVVGGVSGLGIILLHYSQDWAFPIPVWLTNLTINIPLILVALKILGFRYISKVVFGTAIMTLTLFLLEMLPGHFAIETDLLLASVFGGVVCGVAVAMVLRRDATTGGTTLLADLIHRMAKRFTTPRVLMIVDWSIILTGLFVFGTERTMYALIAIFICTVSIEYFTKWPNFTKAVLIISDDSDKVGQVLIERMNRGATSLRGHGVYSGHEKNVLLCVIYDREIARLKDIVTTIDKNAFIIVTEAQEVLGSGFERMKE